VKIQKKKIQIEEIKLKLNYDQVEFNLNFTSDEEQLFLGCIFVKKLHRGTRHLSARSRTSGREL
jgi:hypothetical protein